MVLGVPVGNGVLLGAPKGLGGRWGAAGWGLPAGDTGCRGVPRGVWGMWGALGVPRVTPRGGSVLGRSGVVAGGRWRC